jgi:hypothetical protein
MIEDTVTVDDVEYPYIRETGGRIQITQQGPDASETLSQHVQAFLARVHRHNRTLAFDIELRVIAWS